MQAANEGAQAGDPQDRVRSIGVRIALPFEQGANRYITEGLGFEFHYFFMRKFWFSYLAKAMVVMPGGFGTLDEFMEVVTLVQTLKIKKKLPIVLFGTEYWDKVLHMEGWGMFRRRTPAAAAARKRPWPPARRSNPATSCWTSTCPVFPDW